MVSGTALRSYRCLNPDCRGGHGSPRMLFRASLAPGSVIEERCERCGQVTTIIVGEKGVEMRCREYRQ